LPNVCQWSKEKEPLSAVVQWFYMVSLDWLKLFWNQQEITILMRTTRWQPLPIYPVTVHPPNASIFNEQAANHPKIYQIGTDRL
jgi:hypothetical protein